MQWDEVVIYVVLGSCAMILLLALVLCRFEQFVDVCKGPLC